MKYGSLAGEPRPISRLILGIDHQTSDEAIAQQCDAFLGAGGNAFDTAAHYEAWRERGLGALLERQGLRQQLIVIVKGAHSPYCTPEHVDTQLVASLENLRSERADIFLLHRDNPDVPVGEFVDCLNRHRAAGRIGIIGGSNWTSARLDAANQYASAHGLAGLSVVSNQFGLVTMDPPVWEGALSSGTPEARAWHRSQQFPLIAYTALGRGFLSEQQKVGARGAEVQQSFINDENVQRRERALKLAAQRGVPLPRLALAYVLRQPFPTFVIIGPRSPEQLAGSLPSLELGLSPEELSFLDHGD